MMTTRNCFPYSGRIMSSSHDSRPIIYQVINGLERAGAERMMVDLAIGLRGSGWDVRVVVVRDGPLRSDLELASIPVNVTGYQFDASAPLAMRAMTKLFAKERPAIVHTHLIGSDILGRMAAMRAKMPIIVSTQHDIHKRAFVFNAWRRWSGPKIAATVACSAPVEAYALDVMRVPKAQLYRIDNGVDIEKFASARHPTGKPLTFGAVGTLIPVKGHAVLLEAFSLARSQLPDCRLVVAGPDGGAGGALRQLAFELGVADAVQWRGAVADVVPVLRQTDVFCHPSLAEGQPLAVLEAMAAALPIVGTTAGGIPELLADGECGLLVPPGDATELADAMLVLARDRILADRLGNAALERVRAAYSLEREVAEYGALYRKLLQARGLM